MEKILEYIVTLLLGSLVSGSTVYFVMKKKINKIEIKQKSSGKGAINAVVGNTINQD